MVTQRTPVRTGSPLPSLPQDGAIAILDASTSTGAARTLLLVLLLMSDRHGVITGYTDQLAERVGIKHTSIHAAMRQLRRRGELHTIKSPANRRPGVWRLIVPR